MKWFKIFLLLLWRIWFYFLIAFTLLCMSPFLMFLTARENYYPIFWKLIRVWAWVIIYGMGFRTSFQIDEALDKDKSYMFCSNHTSLLDPFVLMMLSKNPVVFVGKKELTKLPIFGFFYKRVVIMVDRGNLASKKRVYERAREKLSGGTSIGIFPEGLVPTEDVILAPFKNGAFRLAIEYQIPIVPQTYYDCKRFFSWDFLKGGTGTLRARQHPFIETKGLNMRDLNAIKQKVFQIIYKELSADELYMKETLRKSKESQIS